MKSCNHPKAALIDQRFQVFWCPQCGAIKTPSAQTSGRGVWKFPELTRVPVADRFFEAEAALYKHCDIQQTWRVYPIIDNREYYWALDEDEDHCFHSPKKEAIVEYLKDPDAVQLPEHESCFYSTEVHTNRELKTGVFRGKQFTMVLEDTNTDNNIWFALYRNDHEVGFE